MCYGLSGAEYEAIHDHINEKADARRRDGGALILSHGITIELIDLTAIALTAIAPGHRVCCR